MVEVLELSLLFASIAGVIYAAYYTGKKGVGKDLPLSLVEHNKNVICFKSAEIAKREEAIELFLKAQDALQRQDTAEYIKAIRTATEMGERILNKSKNKEAS